MVVEEGGLAPITVEENGNGEVEGEKEEEEEEEEQEGVASAKNGHVGIAEMKAKVKDSTKQPALEEVED